MGDLARFGTALLEHRLLSDTMTTQVLTPRVLMDDGGRKGLGFEVYDRASTRFVGHGGNYWGTMTQIDIYPRQDVVVILSNNDASGGEAVRNWTRRILTAP